MTLNGWGGIGDVFGDHLGRDAAPFVLWPRAVPTQAQARKCHIRPKENTIGRGSGASLTQPNVLAHLADQIV
jgi:hypothetical protein